ncbi:hypothetical protein [Nocardia nepalensis]|uniref:hypothetical protein n=1 Tax=Nocardia nepalensis TaxID=3375448 RepID=UPI003B66C8EE
MSDEQIGGADALDAGTPGQRAEALVHRIADRLGERGPSGWRQLHAVFALTVTTEWARVEFTDVDRVLRAEVPETVMELVRQQRAEAAAAGAGAWWRLLLWANASGDIEVEYDYGDEPFPADQLFRPEAYRADLAVYRRPRLPVWLAAYAGHAGRQARPPRRAAIAARADRAAGVNAQPVEDELPPFPQLWARWATISAAHVAVSSDLGPRMVAANGWYESARNGSSGSTLYLLPGGRAVLSGGVWNAPALNAAYNGGIDLPNLYAGAPDWVTNAVLSPRAAVGLLSFCFWWDGTGWFRGESPSVSECGAAMPGVWTAGTVIETVARLFSHQPDARQRAAVARLLAKAERSMGPRGEITREVLIDGIGADHDIDGALRQFSTAGLLTGCQSPHRTVEFARTSRIGQSVFV